MCNFMSHCYLQVFLNYYFILFSIALVIVIISKRVGMGAQIYKTDIGKGQICTLKANFYNVSHKNRGVAIIFLHEKFDYNDCTPRNGAEDLVNLRNVLTEMQFEIRVYRELKYLEIMNILNNVAQEDHSDADCFLMCVLSHGADGYTYAKDKHYNQEDIWNAFSAEKCPTLIGKPKLFFMQGCRGDELDAGASVRNSVQSDENYTIPSMADVLVMFANNDGYHSSIKPELGSKFIQILCEELDNNYRYYDMLTILTFVNRQMALTNMPSDQTLEANNQAGNIISTLTRLMCFPSKNLRTPVEEKPTIKCKIPICKQMADTYNFTHRRRGVALIFIHERFNNTENKNTNGIEADKKLVECFLSKLGFEIRMYNDLKLAQITEVLTSVANEDHSDADCFLICVSTNGDAKIIHAKDGSYEPEKLWVPFAGDKCKTLTGKPKIFIVQASRGEKLDDGVSVLNTDNQLYTIPAISDILIMYSSYPGYHSWRNPERGSWFIQNLCKELENNYNNYDLMTILTCVNRKMALFCQSNTPNLPEMNKKKQVGNIVSTLTRLMYFYRKKKYVTQSGQLFETPMCEKMADCYNVTYGRRGVALIFIQETFDHLINEQRKGTERDKIAMEKVLSELGFEIRIHRDLIYEQIMDVVSNVAKEDHSDADCLLICVMSLGDSDVIHAKDCTYQPDQLWTQFTGDKCKTLAGKPKLFFVQASRGNKQDEGTTVRCSNKNDTYTIPAMSDILVMYSVYKGYFSWRNVVDGSWLIQSISKEIENNSNYNDFLKILTFVNRRMALFFQSNMPSDKSMHQKKQVSTIMSTLTRRIDFTSDNKSTETNNISKLTVCDKMADSYNFRHKYRGVALIFVHTYFDDNCEARNGIEYDTISLKIILSAFGFEVRIYTDLNRTEIVTIIANVAHEDHSDADCLLICVMSRGNQARIYARDGPYAPDILWTSFSANLCKTLAGKPKLLLIQGGNNSTFDNGAIVGRSIETENVYNYNIPRMSDILIMYSTYKGYYSWRNTNKGSWFIEALCQELNRNYRDSDLMTILTFVNRKVSMFYVSNVVGADKTMGKKKQVCTIVSSLTRLLNFPANKCHFNTS